MSNPISDLSLINDFIEALTKHIDDNKTAIQTGTGNKWYEFGKSGGDGPDRFDHDAIKEHFDRTKIGDKYVEIIEKSAKGIEAQIVTAKIMNDWLATIERDFRMRKTTRIKAVANTATAMEKHTAEKGNLKKGIKEHLEGMILRQGRD